MNTLELPDRSGPTPLVHQGLPHAQLDQTSPTDLQEQLWTRMSALPGVRAGRSRIAVADSRALHLDGADRRGPALAFSPDGTEFAHLHGTTDGSLHLFVPEDDARGVIAHGWGEFHPIVRRGLHPPVLIMVYGPRDDGELETVQTIVEQSYRFAAGLLESD